MSAKFHISINWYTLVTDSLLLRDRHVFFLWCSRAPVKFCGISKCLLLYFYIFILMSEYDLWIFWHWNDANPEYASANKKHSGILRIRTRSITWWLIAGSPEAVSMHAAFDTSRFTLVIVAVKTKATRPIQRRPRVHLRLWDPRHKDDKKHGVKTDSHGRTFDTVNFCLQLPHALCLHSVKIKSTTCSQLLCAIRKKL